MTLKIEDHKFRSKALASAALVLAKNGEADIAKEALDESLRATTSVDQKSPILAMIAEGLARLHYYRQARETVDRCSSSDKLAAYTAILREYHIERRPDQAKLFEEGPEKEK